MNKYNKKSLVLGTFGLGTALIFGVSTIFAAPSSFSIDSISANCNGSGQVSYDGTIPQGGFTLELMNKAPDNSGPFISTVPPTIITISSGSSPISYNMPLTNWSPPHYRIDSNFNTKSPSLNCDTITPTPTPTVTPTNTPTPTPTVTPTNTPTPTPTNTPTPTPTVTPTNTPTPTPTDTVTPTPTNTPTPTPNDNNTCDENERYDANLRICIDCDGEGTCEVIIGNTPTPTPTVTESPSSTPTITPTPTDAVKSENTSSGGTGGPSSNPTTSVLGTTSMASTGSFGVIVSKALLALGLAFSTLAGAAYAKKKN